MAELKYSQVYNRLGEFIEGKSNEELWMERLEEVKKFIDEHESRPNQKRWV